MTSSAQKRVLSDYKILLNNSKILHESGIHYQFDENNLFKMKALIIGAKDTPYENGFYLFNITFPEDYPNLPPIFNYETNFRNIRFNPNLYTSGKVCISLLNTWSGAGVGEGWTPSNNIMSVLNSIQAMVMNEFPLMNEPGYEVISPDHENYNQVLRHENFHTAVLRMINATPYGFDCFLEVMKKHVVDHYEWYLNRIEELHKKYINKDVFKCSYQSNMAPNQYKEIYKNFILLGQSLSAELKIELKFPDEEHQAKILAETKKVVVEPEKAAEKAPKKPSKVDNDDDSDDSDDSSEEKPKPKKVLAKMPVKKAPTKKVPSKKTKT
jgi:ubiquitin-protein ligase